MRYFNINPLHNSTVGFDRLLSKLSSSSLDVANGNRPYNIENTEENSVRITLAVAGFGIEDLSVEANESILSIKGEKQGAEENGNFLFRGITERDFEHRFQLAENVEITGASLENGLLHVDLVRNVPESMKARKIDISVGKSKGNKAVN